MTSLLPASRPADGTAGTDRTAGADGPDGAGRPRPLVLVATLGGLAAAATTLVGAMVVGVVGWYLTDGGAHGAPRDGLRAGALAWVMAHGSGVSIAGARVTAIPLGVTLVCAVVLWQAGMRVGTRLAGHGPDAEQLSDGHRDLTVPLALSVLVAGYVVLAVVTTTVVATPATDPDGARVFLGSLALALVAAGPALAIGSGRAATMLARVPLVVREAVTLARRMLRWFVLACVVVLVVALVTDLSTVANVGSQLGLHGGTVALMVVASLLLLPNAVGLTAAYVVGPGFTFGTGTLVSPGLVVLGPLPLFPLLAALPDDGPTPGWTIGFAAVAPLTALLVAARFQHVQPCPRLDEAALRGCGAGLVAGLVTGVVALLAGGAVGPGRMRDVGPLVGAVTWHAVVSFGLGGLLGAVAVAWWQRRSAHPAAAVAEDDAS